MTDEEFVLHKCLDIVTEALDKLVGACMNEQGKPQAPTYRELMEARGMLPKRCENSFPEKAAKEKK